MITNFITYKVKIRDIEFITPEGVKFDSTAVINFFDINRKEVLYKELGYIDKNTIYEKIKNGENINLSYCYIEDFSILDYRKIYELAKEELINVKSFMAKESIFDAVDTTDFSFICFQNSNVSFQNSLFIHGGVNFNACIFEDGQVSFNSCVFRLGNVNFSNTNFGHGGIDFKNVNFGEGIKDFQYAYFGNGDVLFSNANFGSGEILFINTNFGNGHVSFKVAIFGDGKIDFRFATFGKGEISFERAEFGDGRVDFRTVEFGSGKINFNKAIFGDGEISFEASEMDDGKMLFKNTYFGNGHIIFEQMVFHKAEVNFEKAVFGEGNVSFNKSKYKILSLSSCQLNNYFDLRVDECEILDLKDTVVRDIIDLTPSDDTRVKTNIIDFSGMRLIGQIYIDWKKNHLKNMIYNQENSSNSSKAEQFNLLKQNFNHTGKYNDEDFAYVEFKRNEEKAELEDYVNVNFISKSIAYLFYYFKRLMFDKMGLYATSPMRVFTSTIVIFIIFSMFHFALPYFTESSINCIDPNSGFLFRLLNTFYYSAITFFTIGYGDCSPLGFLRIVAGIQGFFGVFMMSYFTVAFARKVLR